MEPGAVPASGLRGDKGRPCPQAHGPGEGGGAEQPTRWTPLQLWPPGAGAGGAVPGASGGPLEPPQSFSHQATSVHTSLGQGSREDRRDQAESHGCGEVGGHTPATSDPRVGRTEALCIKTPQPRGPAHTWCEFQVPLSVLLQLPAEPAGPSSPTCPWMSSSCSGPGPASVQLLLRPQGEGRRGQAFRSDCADGLAA